MSNGSSRWAYEPRNDRHDRPKHKYDWGKNEAGFVELGRTRIGKCPDDMSMGTAETLLNSGIAVRRGEIVTNAPSTTPPPDNIYAVHEGVVYRAMITRHGQSYHGFPAGSSKRVFRELKEKLLARGRQKGCRDEVEAWMDRYMHVPSL